MDWSSINWEYLGLAAVLAILVGGFVAGATYILTNWHRASVQRRWDRELNGTEAPADVVDFPRQREGDDA